MNLYEKVRRHALALGKIPRVNLAEPCECFVPHKDDPYRSAHVPDENP